MYGADPWSITSCLTSHRVVWYVEATVNFHIPRRCTVGKHVCTVDFLWHSCSKFSVVSSYIFFVVGKKLSPHKSDSKVNSLDPKIHRRNHLTSSFWSNFFIKNGFTAILVELFSIISVHGLGVKRLVGIECRTKEKRAEKGL